MSEREVVIWTGTYQDYDSGGSDELFLTHEDAMRWLRRKWNETRTDEARTVEYWKREYAERAEIEADPDMAARYRELADNPDVPSTSLIDANGERFAEFRGGDARWFIQRREIVRRPTPADKEPQP